MLKFTETIFQQPASSPSAELDWLKLAAVIVTLASIAFGIYQYWRRIQDAKKKETARLEALQEFEGQTKRRQARTAEQRLRDTLEEELGNIRILGSPNIEHLPVKLLDSFVRLNISETWRGESRFRDGKKGGAHPREEMQMEARDPHPEEVMQRAFSQYRLLLLIGDPGSGKTTLMKYFAVCCLGGDQRKLGFKGAVLPLYFPLREIDFDENDEPVSLPKNLAAWSDRRTLDLTPDDFKNWLRNGKTLVLLDGLDEIGDLEQRIRVCDWIDKTCAGFKRARFVLTSRWTGYRKADGVEIAFDHLRADVRDFSPEQQEEFLQKWFRAAFARELPPPEEEQEQRGNKEKERRWKKAQEQKADRQSRAIIKFLRDEGKRKNQDWRGGLRELAAVPMLLQIMAIIWKEREHLPEGRRDLYNAALDYLLALRDKRRKLEPLLSAEKARRVLEPVSWNMQNADKKQRRDEIRRGKMHDQMQPILDSMNKGLAAKKFCRNLIDRAGVLADYGKDDYIFRHKSLREFLAAEQMAKNALKDDAVLQSMCENFGDDWWEEPTRFFMLLADDDMFDRFMAAFFANEKSGKLEVKALDLLQTLVREAPQKKTDALETALHNESLGETQRRTVLECLKTIGAPLATEALKKFIAQQPPVPDVIQEESILPPPRTLRGAPKPVAVPKTDKIAGNADYAREILAQMTPRPEAENRVRLVQNLAEDRPLSFRNPFENNAEYILIPGGEYKFSLSKKLETVPDTYFAKYPLTNRLYRRFMAYLNNDDAELNQIPPLQTFAAKMLEFAETIPDYHEYLGDNVAAWAGKLTSRQDKDRRFNEPEQPVVGVTWFAARAYCLWLSLLETAQSEDPAAPPIDTLANIYRLPKEVEWEWAAAGRDPAGKAAPREYPWPKAKGEPTRMLANYNKNVGKTTPVGRYPEGATPEGLLDMAGNVWEWQENLLRASGGRYALRGGSWRSDSASFVRGARSGDYPVNNWSINIGFRVLRSQS